MGRGNIIGSTDGIAGEVETDPISPKDILATTYHLLGIDPASTVLDRMDRPYPIAGDGVVRPQLFG
jgi:hypothetical protein